VNPVREGGLCTPSVPNIPAEELQITARVVTLIANRLDAEATSRKP